MCQRRQTFQMRPTGSDSHEKDTCSQSLPPPASTEVLDESQYFILADVSSSILNFEVYKLTEFI